MTKLLREWVAKKLDRPDPVQRMTRAELEARADKIAREWLHVSTRDEAFRRLERGELRGTMAEPELLSIREMLTPA